MGIWFDSEKDFEDYVCEKLKDNAECPITGHVPDYVFRQKKIGKYGIADLVYVNISPGISRSDGLKTVEIDISVIELKNTPLQVSDYIQLKRYMHGINTVLDKYARRGFNFFSSVTGVLAGRESVQDSFVFFDAVGVEVYFCDISPDQGFSSEILMQGNWFRKKSTSLVCMETSRNAFNLWKDYEGCK